MDAEKVGMAYRQPIFFLGNKSFTNLKQIWMREKSGWLIANQSILGKLIFHKSQTNVDAGKVGMAYRQPIFQASSLALISLGFAPTHASGH